MHDKAPPRLILASQSPRRAQLLREACLIFEQRSPPFSDPDQPPAHLRGHEADDYAASLARRKARSMADGCDRPALILAADTICVDDRGRLVGKPSDAQDAGRMIRGFVDTTHRVITGVALLQSGADVLSEPSCFADAAVVRFGAVDEVAIRGYLAAGDWAGKAGGYNLFDRQQAGWPITVEGDPATVVGLPMRRLLPMLRGVLDS